MRPQAPLPSAELVHRLAMAERACMTDWLSAMHAAPGNPFGVTIRQFGQATALVCREVPAEVFNRVFGMSLDDAEHLPAILALYQEQRAMPVFDLSPYAIPPFYAGTNVLRILARHGLYQGGWHQLLYGRPTTAVPPAPGHITIEEVGPEDAGIFGRLYEQVWGDGDQIRPLIGRPRFRCYLALVEGEAAALGVLHLADGVGSMANALTVPAFRNRGCQTALLQRRIHDAAMAGCDLLASQCRPGSGSQNNQLRAGLQIAGTKVWWVPLDD